MPKWAITFTGRTKGAIGMFYRITTTREAPTIEEAKLLLYDNYEHIQHPQFIELKELTEAQERWEKKDRIFAEREKSGLWPSKVCPKCKSGCCERTWHHLGDCCIHCGNDERKL